MTTETGPFTRLPDAILLDMDNTLYAYDPPHRAAMDGVRQKMVKAFSISVETFDQTFDHARKETKARLKDMPGSHNRLLYFQRMLEMIGLGSQPVLALDFEQTYWRTFLRHASLFESLMDFLDDCRLFGIPTAIVTDLNAQIQFRKIVTFGLDRCVDYIVTSDETGFDKPNPAIFELALAKIRPKGKSVWMIGDDPVKDIAGSRKAIGAAAIQKLHAGVEEGSGETCPDKTIRHFQEMRDLLSQLGKQRV